MTQLNQILREDARAVLIVANDQDVDDDENDLNQQQEEDQIANDGQVQPKEYDYLLSMPLWSLSLEKVEELTCTMNKKKDEHDALAARHINSLWTEDLDSLLIALEKQEEIDESRDRFKSIFELYSNECANENII